MTPIGPEWLPALIAPVKAVVEFAAALVMARAMLWTLCLGRVGANVVYEGLRFLTRPVEALGAPFAPAGRARLLVGTGMLSALWALLVWAKAAVLGYA